MAPTTPTPPRGDAREDGPHDEPAGGFQRQVARNQGGVEEALAAVTKQWRKMVVLLPEHWKNPGTASDTHVRIMDDLLAAAALAARSAPQDRASGVDPREAWSALVKAMRFTTLDDLKWLRRQGHEDDPRVKVLTAFEAALASRDDVGATPEGGTPASQGEEQRTVTDPFAVLRGWRVWTKGGRAMLGHAIDGDAPTNLEWDEIGLALAVLQRAPRPEER